MRRLIVILSIIGTGMLQAQQLPQFSQYYMNEYAINPAVIGVEDQIEIRSNNRYQWSGITDAPRTYTLSITVPMADEKLGLGAYLFTDIVGPTRRIGFQAGGAYQLPLSDDMKLGVGFSVGMLEYSIDGEKINLGQQNDQALVNILGTSRVVDAKVGVYLHAPNYYFGFSIPQVAQNNLDLYNASGAGNSSLATHYYITGGYQYEINDDYKVEPSLMIKYVTPAPVKLDFTLRGFYKDILWIGGTYRTNDAVAAAIGLKLYDKILVGYSHDFSTSDIRNYSSGTHEVMLGLDIPKPE